jgi:hypothetical protein
MMGKSITAIDFKHELEVSFAAGAPLEQIWDQLRRFKALGIGKQEVLKALEDIREHAADEAVEDRILEVMDYVYGFCSPAMTIWLE